MRPLKTLLALLCLSSAAFAQTPPLWKPESAGSSVLVPIQPTYSVKVPSGQWLLKSSGTGSYNVKLKSAEALGADRDLNLVLGAANRTLTLSGDPTIADWFDQSVKMAATPTFANVTATGQVDTPLITHAGHIDITPGTTNFLDLNYGNGAGAGGVRFVSTTGEGIRMERVDTADLGTMFNYYTNSNAKWSLGPASGSEDYRLYGNGAGANAFVVTAADNTMTITKLAATNATLTTPNIGTPSAGTLTNCTGLPIATGVSGLGANVATFLATPSSANLATALTGETGSGAAVFGTSPTLTDVILNQAANGDTAIKSVRFTDTTPTGNFLDFQSNAASSIFAVDRLGKQTVNSTAVASTAESLFSFKVTDSTTVFSLDNGTATDARFNPTFNGVTEQGIDGVPISFFGTKGVDTATNPAILFLGRHNTGGGNTDLSATVPLVEFRNRATTGAYFTGGYNWQFKGGSTSPSLAAAAADTVSLAGVDNGAGNRELQVQPESGGYIAYGSDTERRVANANRDLANRLKSTTTTDGTQATLDTIAITASSTYLIETRITARRTGGASGTADDGASYVRRGTYTTKSGTVTLMGSVQTIGTDAEDQAGWDATLDINSTNVRVRVTGAASNNISWQAETSVQRISQ